MIEKNTETIVKIKSKKYIYQSNFYFQKKKNTMVID